MTPITLKMATSLPGVYAVNSAQIVHGTLNVNETIRLAEEAMEKVDLAKEDKAYYSAGKDPSLITLGRLPYLAVDGQGKPGEAAFQEAFMALYGVAYTVKFLYKQKRGQDFSVARMEGLYSMPEGKSDFDAANLDGFRWTMLTCCSFTTSQMW